MLRSLIVLCALLIGSPGVPAALITNVFNVNLNNGKFTSALDQTGISGIEFEIVVPTDPFFVQAGDVIETVVNFDQPLTITDTGSGYWSAFLGSPSKLEPIGATYWYSNSISGTGSNASYSMSSELTLSVIDGNPLMTTLFQSVSGGGGGFSAVAAAPFADQWTDTFITIDGLHIRTNFNSYQLNRNDGEVGLFQLNLGGSNITIRSIPEPSTIALMALGIAGIGYNRRQGKMK